MTVQDVPRIVVIGPFPPPVHGMATTNLEVYDQLQSIGASLEKIDTSPRNLNRSLWIRPRRAVKILISLLRFFSLRGLRGGTMYMSVSGGLGQIYECVFIVVARWRRMRIYLRHCSFSYLNRPRFITKLLVKAAGPNSTHITQCEKMVDRLKILYRAPQVIAISNAVLYPIGPVSVRKNLYTTGFLGNISPEKGVFEFLDLMVAMDEEKLPVIGKLAGPFQDARTEALVRVRLKRISNVEYVGPQYGKAKERFFAGIDVLIFPTRYENETEAKVNHEAMSRGIPVIVYGRGCIPDIVDSDCGRIVDTTEPFVSVALAQIKTWLKDSSVFEAASQAAAFRFAATRSQSLQRWQALLQEITGSQIHDIPQG